MQAVGTSVSDMTPEEAQLRDDLAEAREYGDRWREKANSLAAQLEAAQERERWLADKNVEIQHWADGKLQSAQDVIEVAREYAKPLHWSIERDEFKHPRMVWIGPGAERTPVPDAISPLRAALARYDAARNAKCSLES